MALAKTILTEFLSELVQCAVPKCRINCVYLATIRRVCHGLNSRKVMGKRGSPEEFAEYVGLPFSEACDCVAEVAM